MTERYDAVVVGAGPNGLAAAITLAGAGRSVLVLEATETWGGGTKSAELTLPGYVHDICSAIHPLAAVSPFFESIPLRDHGLELVHPEIVLAHPLDDGRAAVQHVDLQRTVDGLGVDGDRYDQLVGYAAKRWNTLAPEILGPLLHLPRHPLQFLGFGLRAVPPATILARSFKTDEARALLAGAAAHAFLPLSRPLTSSFGVMLLASGHRAGWPAVKGGSQKLADAMVSYLRALGGDVRLSSPVRSMRDIPEARAVLFDLTPRQVLAIAGEELPSTYRRRLRRFKYGPGVFKLDYALSEPVPWTNQACRLAGTVHVGGPIEDVARSEADTSAGRVPQRPFVLVAQHSLFDKSRAPEGCHTLWVYSHAPHGSAADMTELIEDQIERFAPGWRDVVLSRASINSVQYEAHNENFVGGDIAGGSHRGLQLVGRPTFGAPYRTANPKLFLCSSSTPPGGGVHGMCGHLAARSALASTLA